MPNPTLDQMFQDAIERKAPESKIIAPSDSYFGYRAPLELDESEYIGSDWNGNFKRDQFFLNTPDKLDEIRAQNQGIGARSVNMLLRFIPGVAGKVVEGAGYFGGLVRQAFKDEDAPFNLGDNVVAEWGQAISGIKDYMPIRATKAFEEANLLQKMTHGTFWTRDVADGLEFLASAYVPGKLIGSAAEALNGLSEATKLAQAAGGLDEGLNAMVLAKQAAATRAAFVGSWAYNTISEAGFESSDAFKSVERELTGQINPRTKKIYTEQEIQDLAGTAAAHTFTANLAALSVSNLWESRLFFRPDFLSAGVKEMKAAILAGRTAKQEFGTLTSKVLKEMALGIGAEGLYEENIQAAIQARELAMAKGERNDPWYAGYADEVGKNLKAFGKSLYGADETKDETDRAMNIMLGAVIGMGGGVHSARSEYRDETSKYAALQNQYEAFKQLNSTAGAAFLDNVRSIYRTFSVDKEVTAADGTVSTVKETSYINPETGKTEVDPEKLTKIVGQRMFQKQMMDQSTLAAMNNDELHDTYINHIALAHYLHNYLTNPFIKGTGQELKAFLNDQKALIQSATSEEDRQEYEQRFQAIQGAAQKMFDSYKDIQKKNGSIKDFTAADEEHRAGFMDMVQKTMWYNAVKAQALEEMKRKTDNPDTLESIDTMIEDANNFNDVLRKNRERFYDMYKSEYIDTASSMEQEAELRKQASTETDEAKKTDLIDKAEALRYQREEDYSVEGNRQVKDKDGNILGVVKNTDNFAINQAPRDSINNITGTKNQYYYDKGKSYYTNTKVSTLANTFLYNHPTPLQEVALLKQIADIVNQNRGYLNSSTRDILQQIYESLDERINDLQTTKNELTEKVHNLEDQVEQKSSEVKEMQDNPRIQFYTSLLDAFTRQNDVQEVLDEYEINPYYVSGTQYVEAILAAIDKSPNSEEIQQKIFEAGDDRLKLELGGPQWLQHAMETLVGTHSEEYDQVSEALSTASTDLAKANIALKEHVDHMDARAQAYNQFQEMVNNDIEHSEDKTWRVWSNKNHFALEFANSKLDAARRILSMLKDPTTEDGWSETYFDSQAILRQIAKVQSLKRILETLAKGEATSRQAAYQDIYDDLKGNINRILSDLEDGLKATAKNKVSAEAIQAQEYRNQTQVKVATIGIQIDENGQYQIQNADIFAAFNEVVGEQFIADILRDAAVDFNFMTAADIIVEKFLSSVSQSQMAKLQALYDEDIMKSYELMKIFAEHSSSLGNPLTNYLSNPTAMSLQVLSAFRAENFEYFNALDPKVNPYTILNESQNIYEAIDAINKLPIEGTFTEQIALDMVRMLNLHLRVVANVGAKNALDSEYKISEHVKQEAIYLDSIKNNPIQIVPSYQQKVTIKQILQLLKKNVTGNQEDNWIYLRGSAGTGKTSLVLKLVTKFAGLGQESIYAFGHNSTSSNEIGKSIYGAEIDGTSKKKTGIVEFLALAGDEANKVKLVVIDEAAALGEQEFNQIRAKMNELNSTRDAANKVRLIALGDPGQILAGRAPYITTRTTKMQWVSPLTFPFRTSVGPIIEAMNAFRRRKSEVDNIMGVASAAIGQAKDSFGNLIQGVQGSQSAEDLKSSIRSNLGNGRQKVIIVNSESDFAKYAEFNGHPEVEIRTYDDVQGMTKSEVYVDISRDGNDVNGTPFSSAKDEIAYNSAIYTAISRASDFAFLVHRKFDRTASNVVDPTLHEVTEQNKAAKEDMFTPYVEKFSGEQELVSKYLGVETTSITQTVEAPVEPADPADPAQPDPGTGEDTPIVPIDPDGIETPDGVIPSEEDPDTIREVTEEPVTMGGIPTTINDTVGVSDSGEHIHELMYPEYNAFITDRDVDGNPTPQKVRAGESPVIYAYYRDRSKGMQVGIFAQRISPDGKYNGNSWHLMGMLGQSEAESLGLASTIASLNAANKSAYFEYDSSRGELTNINENATFNRSKIQSFYDNVTGKFNPTSDTSGTPILLHGKLYSAQNLQYHYDSSVQDSGEGVLRKILKRFQPFYSQISPGASPSYQLHIFTETEIKNDAHKRDFGFKGDFIPKPGIPYLLIRNPHSSNTKSSTIVSTQAVRLSPRKVNTSDIQGGGFLNPTHKFYSIIKEIEDYTGGKIKLGDGVLNHLIKQFSKNFSVNQDTKEIEFVGNNFSEKDFIDAVLNPNSREYSSSHLKELADQGNLELFFRFVQEKSKELIPLYYGVKATPKTYTFTTPELADEAIKNLRTQSGNVHMEFIPEASFKKGKATVATTYRLKLNDAERDGKVKFQQHYTLEVGHGPAQVALNSLARANSHVNGAPFRIKQVIDQNGKKVTVTRAKQMLSESGDTNGAYATALKGLVKEVFGVDSKDAHPAVKEFWEQIKDGKVTLDQIEKKLLQVAEFDPNLHKEMQDTLAQMRSENVVKSMTSDTLSELFKFNTNGEHESSSGYYLRLPLRRNNLVSDGKVVSPGINDAGVNGTNEERAKIESQLSSKFVGVSPTRVQVELNQKINSSKPVAPKAAISVENSIETFQDKTPESFQDENGFTYVKEWDAEGGHYSYTMEDEKITKEDYESMKELMGIQDAVKEINEGLTTEIKDTTDQLDNGCNS